MGIDGLEFIDENGNKKTFRRNENVVGFLDRYGRYVSSDDIDNHAILAKDYIDNREDLKAEFERYVRNGGRYHVPSDWLVIKKGFVKVMQRAYGYSSFEKLTFTYSTRGGKENITNTQSKVVFGTMLKYGERKVKIEPPLPDEEISYHGGDYSDR